RDAVVRPAEYGGESLRDRRGVEEARLRRGDAGLHRRHQAGGGRVRPALPEAGGHRPRGSGGAGLEPRGDRSGESRRLRRALTRCRAYVATAARRAFRAGPYGGMTASTPSATCSLIAFAPACESAGTSIAKPR